MDLLTNYAVPTAKGVVNIQFAGGLLGHWGCWTQKTAGILEQVKNARGGSAIPKELLTLAAQVTDCNGAIFDAANQYAGALPGIHDVLRRQGLLENIGTLDPAETLSPGQSAEIDRVYQAYPHLNDDEFVRENLATWLA